MSGLERKHLSIDFKGDGRTAGGVAMIFGVVDRDRDITTGPINGRVPLLEGHAWDRRPVGVAELSSDAKQARASITFLGTAGGREAGDTVKELFALGVAQPLSIGFIVDRARAPNDEERQRGAVRVLEKITVVELSLVVAGAVPGAMVSSVKCAGCEAKGPDQATEQLFREVRRSLERAETLRKPNGGLALHCAEWAAARLHSPVSAPLVRFFEPDGKRLGYFTSRTPDCVYVAKGLALPDLIAVVVHEVTHLVDWPHESEVLAEHAEALLAPRYRELYGL